MTTQSWYAVVCTEIVQAVFGSALKAEAEEFANKRTTDSGWAHWVKPITGDRPHTGQYIGNAGSLE